MFSFFITQKYKKALFAPSEHLDSPYYKKLQKICFDNIIVIEGELDQRSFHYYTNMYVRNKVIF